jgi:hypothetical protein
MLVVLGAVPARAQTLDQSQLTQNTAACAQGSAFPFSFAQTFTAGLTGDLVRVDLEIFHGAGGPTQPLTVEIRTVDTITFKPTGTVLASETLLPGDVPTAPGSGLTTVLIDPPVAVTAGTQYAIVLYTAETVASYCWAFQATAPVDPYPGGAFWFSQASPPTAWALSSLPGLFDDFVFATYVDTTYALPNQVTNLAVSGSTLRFRLAAPATVRFSLDKRVTRYRFRRIGKFTTVARRGRNRVRIPRRLGGRRVGKGLFRLSARASGGGPLSRRLVRIR